MSSCRVTSIQISQTRFQNNVVGEKPLTRTLNNNNTCFHANVKKARTVSQWDRFVLFFCCCLIVTSRFPRRPLLGTKAVSSLCCGQVKLHNGRTIHRLMWCLKSATSSHSTRFFLLLVHSLVACSAFSRVSGRA